MNNQLHRGGEYWSNRSRRRRIRQLQLMFLGGLGIVLLVLLLIVLLLQKGRGNGQNTAIRGSETESETETAPKDLTAPELQLKGKSEVNVAKDGIFTDDGYTASDDIDGNITAKVKVSGTVDTTKVGDYEITYSVTDAAGNAAQEVRMVHVVDMSHVVYLTFDDGPGKYTQKLLDVLDKYHVKVTFFVTNQYPDYQDLIKKEYEAGHTVAIHTYSHDYEKIYQSTDAFFEDMDKMSDICFEQTGERPVIFRFPGGSSNTVSRHYCDGIMTALTKEMEKRGYHYADWNVTSGDAGETTKTEVVVQNVIEGIKGRESSVVLQHDIKEFSVNAVEEIIKWGQENGYTFLPMDETSPMAHHGVLN